MNEVHAGGHVTLSHFGIRVAQSGLLNAAPDSSLEEDCRNLRANPSFCKPYEICRLEPINGRYFGLRVKMFALADAGIWGFRFPSRTIRRAMVEKTGQTDSGLQTPRVSVIIPAFNTASFIGETLQSVFAQSFTDFEVILINDGSPDTPELERNLRAFARKIIYLKQPNRGPSAARNTGIRAARGEFLAFLDSDDTWLPEYLSSQMKSFEDSPELDLVCTDTMFYGDPQFDGQTFFSRCRLQGPVSFPGMLIGNPLTTSCVVARTRVVMEAGLFDETLRVAEDYDLWLRIAAGGAVIKRRWKVLGRHRLHPGGLSAEDETLWLKSHIQVLGNVEKSVQVSPDLRQEVRRQVICFRVLLDMEQGKRYLATGSFEQAMSCFGNANALVRSRKVHLLLMGLRIAPRLTRWGARMWEHLSPLECLRSRKTPQKVSEPPPEGLL